MEYISYDDIQDEVLRCSYDDIVIGNEAIERLAAKLGVSEITEPVSSPVRRFGVAVACYNCCLRKAGTDPTVTFNGAGAVENSDIYSQKLKMYKTEIERLSADISALDFGVTGGRGRTSIPLYRA